MSCQTGVTADEDDAVTRMFSVMTKRPVDGAATRLAQVVVPVRQLMVRLSGENTATGWRNTMLPIALMTVLCVGGVLWFGQAWLSAGLPDGDLGGAVADLARWQAIVAHGELWASWDSHVFFGHPRSLMNLYAGMALAYAPFLVLGGPLAAVKIGSLVYLGLSGVSAFCLARSLTRHVGLSMVLGLLYALHPIHLSVGASTAHANFPPFYFLAPWLVLSLLQVLRRPTPRRVAVLASLTAVTAWIDLERVAVLGPGLAILAIVMVSHRACRAHAAGQSRWMVSAIRPVLAMLGAGALAVGLLAYVLLPAAVEKGEHALFSDGEA